MFRLLGLVTRRLFRPFSRPAVVFLMWTQRYTVALWWRSVVGEARYQVEGRSFDAGRWSRLARALWRVSADARLANAPELRRLSVDELGIAVDAEETWHARILLDSRLGT